MYFALKESGGDIPAARLPELGERIGQIIEWNWTTDPHMDMRRAMETLESEIGSSQP